MVIAVTLASRPAPNSAVELSNFAIRDANDGECDGQPDSTNAASTVDGVPLARGLIRVKLLALSVDPYMRCRFNSCTGADYLTPFDVNGRPIVSGGSARVIESADPTYKEGDVVVSQMEMPWQEVQTLDPSAVSDLIAVPDGIVDPLLAAGPLGMPGLSAWHAVAQCDPKEGELCVLSSCAGAVGSVAGQLLRCRGARVLGICGSRSKCDWSIEIGAVDAALCYRDEDFAERLAEHSKEGFDLYFDNVGGWISEEVIWRLAPKGRVMVVGQIATYCQDTATKGYVYPDQLPAALRATMEARGVTRERFFVGWYKDQNDAALGAMQSMLANGEMKMPVSWVEGLENAPRAFMDMMDGKYKGKVMVRV